MDAALIGSKEICLVERSMFALSLTPISINLCIKANYKKTIISVLQPILDMYQIKMSNSVIYMVNCSSEKLIEEKQTNLCLNFKNATGCVLNLNDMCSTVDNQHVLIVHKHQSNRLYLNRILILIIVSFFF